MSVIFLMYLVTLNNKNNFYTLVSQVHVSSVIPNYHKQIVYKYHTSFLLLFQTAGYRTWML